MFIKACGAIFLASPLAKPSKKPPNVGALSAPLRVVLQGMEPGRKGHKSSSEANRELEAQYPYAFNS